MTPKPKDEGFGALLALGLAGVAVGLLAASIARDSSEERRRTFKEHLAGALREQTGQILLGATLGRGADNHAFWELTLQDGHAQLWSVRVPLEISTDPYDQSTHDKLIETIVQHTV